MTEDLFRNRPNVGAESHEVAHGETRAQRRAENPFLASSEDQDSLSMRPDQSNGVPVPSEKISFFGARKAAERLQAEKFALEGEKRALEAEVAAMRNALQKYEVMGLIQLQKEVDTLQAMRQRLQSDFESTSARYSTDLKSLQTDLEQTSRRAAEEKARIKRELIDLRHALEAQDVSLYDYEHPAESSTVLATELARVRESIKAMVRDKTTYTVSQNFTFNNSEAKGRKFTSDMAKTMLAAYNSEAENAIKSIKAGGFATGKARLERVLNRVVKNGSMVDLVISPQYHFLRLKELELADRHLQTVKMEREAERERKAELREQQKAEAELRREKERLEKERKHYLNVLKTLRERGDEEEALKIESQLADVDLAINDVDYRAANIRAGYVYVISNIGTMGEKMVKIGMTRRLEPMDRVRELGDASVPFPFDVHALFFAEDAVNIETMLHREFSSRRVNLINRRREFFYCTPDEVLDKLKAHGVSVVEYTLEPEAEQYRQSRLQADAESPEGAFGEQPSQTLDPALDVSSNA